MKIFQQKFLKNIDLINTISFFLLPPEKLLRQREDSLSPHYRWSHFYVIKSS